MDIRCLICRLATKQPYLSNCPKHTWPPAWTRITLFSQTAHNQQTTGSITGRTACHMQILFTLCAVWVSRALLTAADMWPYITIYAMFSSMRRISGGLWPALGVSALWGCPWHLGPSQWPRRETWSFLLRSPGRTTNTSMGHPTTGVSYSEHVWQRHWSSFWFIVLNLFCRQRFQTFYIQI